MAQSLAEEGEVQRVHRVNEHLIRLRTKRELSSTRTHLDRHDLVRVRDVGNGVANVAVPKENGGALASRDELELIINALGHSAVGTVVNLAPVHSLF